MTVDAVLTSTKSVKEIFGRAAQMLSSAVALVSAQLEISGPERPKVFKPATSLDGTIPEPAADYPYDRKLLPAEHVLEGSALTVLREPKAQLEKRSSDIASETGRYLFEPVVSDQLERARFVSLSVWGQSDVWQRVSGKVARLTALRRMDVPDGWLNWLARCSFHWSAMCSRELTILIRLDESLLGLSPTATSRSKSEFDSEVFCANISWAIERVRSFAPLGETKEAISFDFDGLWPIAEEMERLARRIR
jgi:hypothetical protein